MGSISIYLVEVKNLEIVYFLHTVERRAMVGYALCTQYKAVSKPANSQSVRWCSHEAVDQTKPAPYLHCIAALLSAAHTHLA